MRFYEVDQRGIVDAAVHAADEERAGITDTGGCLDGGLGDRTDGVIIKIDTVEIADEFQTVVKTGKGLDTLSDFFRIQTENFCTDPVNESGIELIMRAFELHIEVHRCIKIQECFLRFRVDFRNIISVEKIVTRFLMDRDILLRIEVVFHGLIAVQMILVEIEEYGHMRGELQIRKLMAGKLVDDGCAFMDRIVVVEAGKADVAA